MSIKAPRRRRKAFSQQDIASFLGHHVPVDRPGPDETDLVLSDVEEPCATDVEDPSIDEPGALFGPRLHLIPD
jgi:hypothetical protein